MTVGYRVRFGSKVSRATRIEVVTEGIFTRLVLDDPALDGHRRRAVRRVPRALARRRPRPGAGARRAKGSARGPQATGHVGNARRRARRQAARRCAGDRKRRPRVPGRDALCRARCAAADRAAGYRCGPARACGPSRARCWSFCPAPPKSGAPRLSCASAIAAPDIDIVALYGALDAEMQDRAIAPAPPGRRKVVLATSIAETSLTIEGVRVVIDSGLARVPRYEPDVGLTRLETVRVSRASADQRRGRAGRTEPGVCYRLWDEPQTAALEPANQPEILAADLSGFVLDLAHWGVADPAALAFLDPPPRAGAVRRRRRCCASLAPSMRDGRITDEGRRLRALPLPPRLARMVVDAAGLRRRPSLPPRSPSFSPSVASAATMSISPIVSSLASRPFAPRARCACDGEAVGGMRTTCFRRESRRYAGTERQAPSVGALLALAYPDRIAKNRGAAGAFLLANGRGAHRSGLGAGARAVSCRRRDHRHGRARPHRAGAPLSLDEIEAQFADRIESREEIVFDAASGSLRARRLRRLGAIMLAEQPMPVDAERRDRTHAGGWHRAGSGSIGCRGPSLCSNGATASDFCVRSRVCPSAGTRRGKRRRRMAGPLGCRAGGEHGGLACAGACRQDRACRPEQRRTCGGAARPAAVELAPPPRRRGAHPFRRAVGFGGADRLRRPRRVPSLRSACRSCSALTAIPPSPADGCRWWSSCCRRRIGRCR